MSNPESIKNLIPRPNRSDMQSLQKPSPPSWQREILATYKTGENLLYLFSPDKQTEYCKNEERCFTGHAPSIARVARTFGDSVAESWLSIQLFELAEFSKVRNGMEPADFIELARTIISGYGDFKLTEFMVFFLRFKQDKYDQFFGTFTPGTVTRSLIKFNSDRKELLRFYEDKKGRRKGNGNGSCVKRRKRHPCRFKKLSTNTAKRKVKYERHRALQRLIPEL